MMIDSTVKAEIKKEYQQHEKDTGSVEVQVALFSRRISDLTEHFKVHKHDNNSRRGLLLLVQKRRKLLDYLRDSDFPRYQKLIARLGLRR
ncbi:MAG: 30S ribosomal protein S15 [Kiritimatiellae bacterium]|nr:30S ribosomal protein S15 [Kiritimatiellia bacterium]MBQ9344832.1 30S ribosomal protein S15 [Kiritimatiellia bacterium]